MADAFLNHSLGEGYEYWENFYEFHKLAYDELEAFDYEEFKKKRLRGKVAWVTCRFRRTRKCKPVKKCPLAGKESLKAE